MDACYLIQLQVVGKPVLWNVDPDPHSFWSTGSGSALGIRIRIQEGQKRPTKVKKVQVLKC
jgi:hypothetical protein